MTENEVLIKTPEEAIETIKSNMPTSGYQMLRESLDMAITALKEVQQYREIGSVEQVKNQKENLSVAYRIIGDYESIGTVKECREAVEKQKAKKIIIRNWNPTRCPTCGHELSTSLGDGYYKHPTFLERCPNCGQAIQWDENLE